MAIMLVHNNSCIVNTIQHSINNIMYLLAVYMLHCLIMLVHNYTSIVNTIEHCIHNIM